jgi:DNA-binding response OmpR family regulator
MTEIHNPTVLLVCDDPVKRSAWAACLMLQNLPAIQAEAETAALQALGEDSPGLVLVDLLDAEGAGLALCEHLRCQTEAPILFLIPYASEALALRGYQVGADEVIAMPLSPAVCLAKMNAWMRRSQAVYSAPPAALEHPGLRLDPNRREAVIDDQQRVRLSRLEFRLLWLLMHHPGRVFPSGELVQRVWGCADPGGTVVLKNLVYHLRRKIEPQPAQPRFLRSHGQQGYSFTEPGL